jgi:hypothetical protein
MNKNDLPENALVMVAILPSPKDLEIARVLGWYRIPMRMAPKIVDVDYMVFYQTGKFPLGHDSLIESFAEVCGHELTTRAELIRDEPNHPHAQEEYYKIQLGPLTPLPKPIPAHKWKRITFFYTLGNLVNEALTIKDLMVKSDDREILWKSLRERNLAPYLKANRPMTQIPDEELMTLIQQVIAWNHDLGINEKNIVE